MPCWSRSAFVTNRSSPTSWTRSPSRRVSALPRVPVVLGGAVLDRHDRVRVERARARSRPCSSERELAALEAVAAVARRPRSSPGRARSRRARGARRARPPRGSPRSRPRSTSRSGAKPPSSPTPVESPRPCEHLLERVVHLGADPQRLGERPAPTGTTMNSCRSIEFVACAPPLITFIIGTGSVARAVAAEVAEERDARVGRGGLRGRERDAEDRVRAEPALVRRAVELDQRRSSPAWSAASRPTTAPRDLAAHVRDRLRHALAAATPAAVAQLDRLVHAGRGAGGDRRAPERAGLERDVDLDGRVPARVEDPAGRARTRFALIRSAPWRGRSIDPARRAAASGTRGPPPPRAPPPARRAPRTGRVAPRSASSGSTFSRRATLTAANSTSPSSSNTCAVGSVSAATSPPASSSASSSSRTSSSRSASAPAVSGYSKPTAAARRCTFRA